MNFIKVNRVITNLLPDGTTKQEQDVYWLNSAAILWIKEVRSEKHTLVKCQIATDTSLDEVSDSLDDLLKALK